MKFYLGVINFYTNVTNFDANVMNLSLPKFYKSMNFSTKCYESHESKGIQGVHTLHTQIQIKERIAAFPRNATKSFPFSPDIWREKGRGNQKISFRYTFSSHFSPN